MVLVFVKFPSSSSSLMVRGCIEEASTDGFTLPSKSQYTVVLVVVAASILDHCDHDSDTTLEITWKISWRLNSTRSTTRNSSSSCSNAAAYKTAIQLHNRFVEIAGRHDAEGNTFRVLSLSTARSSCSSSRGCCCRRRPPCRCVH
jgi:hypothetical protein